MVDLVDGARYLLHTQRGLLNLIARYDRRTSTWVLVNGMEQPQFRVADDQSLAPVGSGGADVRYAVRDLHEWARLV